MKALLSSFLETLLTDVLSFSKLFAWDTGEHRSGSLPFLVLSLSAGDGGEPLSLGPKSATL